MPYSYRINQSHFMEVCIMKRDSLSYEAIQSMLLEKRRSMRCSAVSVTSSRYVSNSIFKMMKAFGFQEYCEEGSALVLR